MICLLLKQIQLYFWPISRAIAARTILTGPVTHSSINQWNEMKAGTGAGARKQIYKVLVGRLWIVIKQIMTLRFCV